MRLRNTSIYKALQTLNLVSGSITLTSLTSVAFFAWAMYVIFSPPLAERYRFFDIRFNYEEEIACENELLKNCRPDITQRIQSAPHSLQDEPLKRDEHRLLDWHRRKSDHTQTIMYNYMWEQDANRNDGYVLKFYIPQHGPRQGKVSAPAEIEPYIQSAINRCIDSFESTDFSGGGVIGKLEKGKCVYEDFYLAPSKWNQYFETAGSLLRATVAVPFVFFATFLGLLVAIPSAFIALAIVESILKLVILSFKPRNQQKDKSISQNET